MKIRARLVAGLAALLLIPALLGTGALFALLHYTLSAMDEVVEEALEEAHPLMRLQVLALRAAMPANDYLVHGDPAERDHFARLSRKLDEAFSQALAAPLALEEERDLLRAAREEWRKAGAIAGSLFARTRSPGNPAAARDVERMDAHIERAVDLLEQAHGHAQREVAEARARAHAARHWAVWLVAGIFAVAGGIAAAVAFWLARSILVPLRKLEGAAVRFGAGDLAHRIAPLADDELGQLAAGFNAMAEAVSVRTARLEALGEIAVAIGSSLSLEEILERAMRLGIALTGARASCVAFYDSEARRFTRWVTHGLSEHFVNNMAFQPGGLADEVFTTGTYILSNDRPQTKHKLSKLARAEGVLSFICLPLAGRSGRLGVLYAYRTDRDVFYPDEIELLQSFAALAAGAIENARLYAEKTHQARTDPLTGLPNRRQFDECLLEEFGRTQRYGSSLAVLLLDIDRFKDVNDSHGHTAGDAVLTAVMQILARELRNVDTAARYGGEEFVALLPEADGGTAKAVAERVRRAVAAAPLQLPDGKEVGVTVSIGICSYPDSATSAREVIDRADQAMYTAKQAGRNRVVLYHEMLKAEIERNPQRIVELLNQGLENIPAIVTAVSGKAPFMRGHTEQVERIAGRLGTALGLSEPDREALRLASLLHDAGMVIVPDAILSKTTPLSPEEWETVRQHPVTAANLLAQVPALWAVVPLVRHHHERWDGGGYPDGLKGEAIPYLARVLAVADACAAMLAAWPGRMARSAHEAKEDLRAGAGTQFDPRIVEAALGALN